MLEGLGKWVDTGEFRLAFERTDGLLEEFLVY
jgi:hypothetical protein